MFVNLFLILLQVNPYYNHKWPCDSPIYCHGRLLSTFQMAALLNGSKDFVDISLSKSVAETLNAFNMLMNDTNDRPSRIALGEFVSTYFRRPGDDLIEWEPDDWRQSPKFLARIRDSSLRKWAAALNLIWKRLGRRVRERVHHYPERHSLIYVPHPFIVPGGRFREYYYWDTYWIIKGLLLCEMRVTAQQMLENFVWLVGKYKHVPNGGRNYYSSRSHPPLLALMFQLYLDYTADWVFVLKHLHALEEENRFWARERSVEVEKDGRTYHMFRYRSNVEYPRPEEFRHDTLLARGLNNSEASRLYRNLHAAAESGWDFSSRWFIQRHDEEQNNDSLRALDTSNIIAVDLNAILCRNSQLLQKFAERANDWSRAKMYRKQAEERLYNLHAVLWDQSEGAWFDWDLRRKKFNRRYFASSSVPIWLEMSNTTQESAYLQYILRNNITEYIGGTPVSTQRSGQQWDFPNTWPPLHYVTVMALWRIGTAEAKSLAVEQTQRWVGSAYTAYRRRPHVMLEKYDVTVFGKAGGGGEYGVQTGFGWTNGVAIALCDKFGEQLIAPSVDGASRYKYNTNAL